MQRRGFIAGAGILVAAACAPKLAAASDEEAVKQAVANVYAAFSGDDKQYYRSLLTPDYLLLEHGELLDIEGDIAMMAPPGSRKRTDSFDFRSVKVHGDIAWAVYFLKSEITDQKGTQHRQWLESAILRRDGRRWLMALLHSTRLEKPAG